MPRPTRTCIATRDRRPDLELLRVVLVDGAIIADPARRMPGRGAWITPTTAALDLAVAKRAFARAFRYAGPVDTGHVRTYLEELAHGPTCKEDRPLMSTQR